MENVGLTKRRVSGGITVEAPASRLARADGVEEPGCRAEHPQQRGDAAPRWVSEHRSELAAPRRLDLKTDMTLEVEADDAAKKLGSEGFRIWLLEFVGSYTLKPQSAGPYQQ